MPPTTEWYKITSGENDRLSIIRIVNLCSLSLMMKIYKMKTIVTIEIGRMAATNIIDKYIKHYF